MSSEGAPATRDAILDAARSLFEAKGYFGVGLETVAKQAGVSRQAIYLHFDSKAALLRALHERVNEQDVVPAHESHGVWEAQSAEEALEAFVAVSGEVVPKIRGIANALIVARRVDPDVEATWEAPSEGRYADCRRLAEWMARDRVLVRGVGVEDAADILFGVVSIWSYENLVIDRSWSTARWVEWVTQVMRRELLGKDGPRRRAHSRGGTRKARQKADGRRA